MNTFDERKKAFESKFKQDEDLKFKLRARRNKKIAVWAAELVGKTNDENYIREVRESDLVKPGDDDIIEKLLIDFNSNNINLTSVFFVSGKNLKKTINSIIDFMG